MLTGLTRFAAFPMIKKIYNQFFYLLETRLGVIIRGWKRKVYRFAAFLTDLAAVERIKSVSINAFCSIEK